MLVDLSRRRARAASGATGRARDAGPGRCGRALRSSGVLTCIPSCIGFLTRIVFCAGLSGVQLISFGAAAQQAVVVFTRNMHYGSERLCAICCTMADSVSWSPPAAFFWPADGLLRPGHHLLPRRRIDVGTRAARAPDLAAFPRAVEASARCRGGPSGRLCDALRNANPLKILSSQPFLSFPPSNHYRN